MRIGIFGGSFDPVHSGHLIVAECCREQASLDRVTFVPAAVPPHKQERVLAPAEQRIEMLTLATGGHDNFFVDRLEIDRGGVSYTFETVEKWRREKTSDDLLLILGLDALEDFPNWKNPERILQCSSLLAVERIGTDDLQRHFAGGTKLRALLGSVRMDTIVETRVRVPMIGVRSSDLRKAVNRGESIRYQTSRAVETFIRCNRLYRSE